MSVRIHCEQAAPEAVHALLNVENYVRQCGLETRLLELVRLRASQINGCAFCVDMHAKDARAEGESEQRFLLPPSWQDCGSSDESRPLSER